ncbi:MAG TPA: BBE domain-containing protein, partial [Thermoleophilaceae bacterium]|nr:BBE domain-containing protein [Thermoleophilaceae bacterium]
ENAPQGLDPLTQIIVFRHGGAVSRIGDEETAFSNRGPAYLLHPLAAWMEPANDDRHIAWLCELVRVMEPFKTGGAYLNFSPEGEQWLLDGYGRPKYERLVALKQRYDPHKLFRFSHNIPPAGADLTAEAGSDRHRAIEEGESRHDHSHEGAGKPGDALGGAVRLRPGGEGGRHHLPIWSGQPRRCRQLRRCR